MRAALPGEQLDRGLDICDGAANDQGRQSLDEMPAKNAHPGRTNAIASAVHVRAAADGDTEHTAGTVHVPAYGADAPQQVVNARRLGQSVRAGSEDVLAPAS